MALLAALGHVANLGQFVEIGQGHAHQREQIRWTRRNYALDSQALKIDLLGAARDDVRGTYDTYVERLDSLLLLNALLLPFALNTLQFSDQFVPGLDCLDRPDPDSCIEMKHPWLQTLWVYLVGIDLFVPFWSILMLLHCKRKLDSWLQHTLGDLQLMRRGIMNTDILESSEWTKQVEDQLAEEQKRVVATLGGFIVDYQEIFMQLWNEECAPLVAIATLLLWASATIAITLTAFMFWIYLADRETKEGARASGDYIHFGILSIIGLGIPLAYFLRVWILGRRRSRSNAATGTIAGDLRSNGDELLPSVSPMAIRRESLRNVGIPRTTSSSSDFTRPRPFLMNSRASAAGGSDMSLVERDGAISETPPRRDGVVSETPPRNIASHDQRKRPLLETLNPFRRNQDQDEPRRIYSSPCAN